MSPSLTIPRPSPTRARPAIAPYLAAAAFLALAIPLLPRAVWVPPHVAAVVVGNDSAYAVTVDVVDADGSRIPVGSLQPGTTATFREIVDVGERWTFVYGSRGSEVTRTTERAALARDGWRADVPAELGDRLDAAGEPPTPRS